MQPDLHRSLRLRCSPSGQVFLPATLLCDGETHKAEFTTGKAADPPRRAMVFFLANSSESTQGGGRGDGFILRRAYHTTPGRAQNDVTERYREGRDRSPC